MSEQINEGTIEQSKLSKKNSDRSKMNKKKTKQPKKLSTEEIQFEKHLPLRQVIIDPTILPKIPEKNRKFASNKVSTTKYNAINFLPKSLLVQFLRVSNIFFLATSILMCIPVISPLPAVTSIGPLSFVLAMSMLREAYEDFKRRKNDKMTNNQKCYVMRRPAQKEEQNNINIESYKDQINYKAMFEQVHWRQVRCGDILFLEEGQYFPVDAILLKSSAQNGECFVQTSSLDGERALKHKQCLVPIQYAIETVGLQNFICNVHCENPSKNLFKFNGYMESTQFPENNTLLLSPESNLRTCSLDQKQMALRGSNLANTDWVLAAAIYTGKETKLMMNSGKARYKQSKIEKQVNIIVIYQIIVLAILCFLMALYSGFYTSNYASEDQTNVKRRAEYIFFGGQQSQQGKNDTISQISTIDYIPTVEGLKTLAQYFILLNTLIPISLIVALEFVKLLQTPFIQHDVQMFDEISCQQATPLSLTLHEELAGINYIFADKTGTLTSNIMQFMSCSIGSVCYDDDYKEEDYEYQIDNSPELQKQRSDIQVIDRFQFEDEKIQQEDDEKAVKEFVQMKEQIGEPYTKQGSMSKINRRKSATEILWNYNQATSIIRALLLQKKYFINEETILGKTNQDGKSLILTKQNDYLKQFWLSVSLCHDVIATKHKNSDALAYQGTSPDEITLLDAAKEVGFMFVDRNSETMTLDIFGQRKVFLLHQKIEFTSERKKMSVVIEDQESGMIILYTKGADFAIFERLSVHIEQHFLEATKEDLIKFSTKGFRTLCFAIRVLDREYFNDWQNRFEKAKLENIKKSLIKVQENLEDENIVEKLQNELENELFLLGATALEDKLQEGVPEAIEDFHNAGIKVWMLTGDKLETAENIGFSSKMFNEKMYIFKLQTHEKEHTRQRLLQIDNKIQEIQNKHVLPIVGTQFILNPNAVAETPFQRDNVYAHDSYEARNIIKALEEYKHESRGSEYTMNDSWAKRPVFKRKLRKRLEEIVPDKSTIVENLIRENQLFTKSISEDIKKYVPRIFDMKARQYIVRRNNIYRPSTNVSNNKDVSNTEDTFGVLIEGQTLHHITESNSMKKKFLKILSKCSAVVVCRASPSQKATVVQMVKENEKEAITLAIGDGANDVNMIQKAHVGIGIYGKEGYQAASSCDYAIGQFRFLRRLLFVHGRWNGFRLTNFMLLFFHKNIIFTLPQFWFGWQNGFSAQTFYEDKYIISYNVFITGFFIGAYACWDQDINLNDPKKNQLIELFFPFIYKNTRQEELFTKKKFLFWTAIAILQSLFIYGIPVIAQYDFIHQNGFTLDLWDISLQSYYAISYIHYLFLLFFVKNWTLWMLAWLVGSYQFFQPSFILLANLLASDQLKYRLKEIAFSNVQFWFITLGCTFITTLPVLFYFTVQSILFPSLKDLIQQDRIDFNDVMREADPKTYKTTHDLYKQQQQQLLLKWQMEYQNFQKKSPDKNEEIKDEDDDIQQITRKGLQLGKQQTSSSKQKKFNENMDPECFELKIQDLEDQNHMEFTDQASENCNNEINESCGNERQKIKNYANLIERDKLSPFNKENQ